MANPCKNNAFNGPGPGDSDGFSANQYKLWRHTENSYTQKSHFVYPLASFLQGDVFVVRTNLSNKIFFVLNLFGFCVASEGSIASHWYHVLVLLLKWILYSEMYTFLYPTHTYLHTHFQKESLKTFKIQISRMKELQLKVKCQIQILICP